MLTLGMSIWLAVLMLLIDSDMVLLGPMNAVQLFAVAQSSSFFANCSYLR